MSYQELLSHWRFAPVGDQWFEGETGKYWGQRMSELKRHDPTGTAQASKDIGWN